MKKLISLITLMLVALCFVSCDKESGEGVRKSDIVGTWERSGVTMKIKSDNTYDCYMDPCGTGSPIYKYEMSGTYSFDSKARVWVQHRNDGHSYTNVILLLDETTFSYMDQYGNNEIWARK